MSNSAIATPTLLTDPGFLYWAPIGTAVPTHTVVASVFSDAWPVAWIPLGMTASGSKLTNNITVSPIPAAESFYPLAFRTTEVAATVAFNLLSITATNLARTLNGSAGTVTGATTTLLTKIDPPAPGSEVRSMIGYESLDSTLRFVAYQVINSGSVELSFDKAPSTTSLPWTASLEKPVSTQPFSFWTAGAARGA